MKPKILISGIHYDGGGLGNVMSNLVHHLSADFEVTCIAFIPSANKQSQPLKHSEAIVHNIQFKKSSFILPDNSEIAAKIRDNEYSSIIILGPVKLNSIFIHQLRELSNKIQITSFIPYEGKVINTLDASVLNKLDAGVFYSKFTYDCYHHLVMDENIIEDFESKFSYAYHGVDEGKFFPLSMFKEEKISMARSKISEYQSLPANAFIILNSNKPYYRKGLDSTLTAFKEFAAQRADCFLHLHFGSMTNNWYQHVASRIAAYGLGEKVITTHTNYPSKVHSDEWMNHLYNACNVGLSTSYGEGWGLGIFEHAATGAPVVVPNHTVFKENWKDIALLTDICDTKYLACENTEIYIPSKKSIVEALKKLYDSRELYDYYAEACYTHVTSGKYDWKKTSALFSNLLEKNCKKTFLCQ